MKLKSIFALAFTLSLVACGSKGEQLKEITQEQAAARASNYTVQGVVDNAGRYFVYQWKVTVTSKKGVFAKYTDEELCDDELTGKVTYVVEDEYDWVIALSDNISHCISSDEETYRFFVRGNGGLVIKFVSHYSEPRYFYDETYFTLSDCESKSTYGKYGQLVKWYGEYQYTINPEEYPEGDVTGSFSMKWEETYTYTNNDDGTI